MPVLVEDPRQFVLQVAGGPRAVVAPNWGGLCAGHFVMAHPEVVTKLVTVNSPGSRGTHWVAHEFPHKVTRPIREFADRP